MNRSQYNQLQALSTVYQISRNLGISPAAVIRLSQKRSGRMVSLAKQGFMKRAGQAAWRHKGKIAAIAGTAALMGGAYHKRAAIGSVVQPHLDIIGANLHKQATSMSQGRLRLTTRAIASALAPKHPQSQIYRTEKVKSFP